MSTEKIEKVELLDKYNVQPKTYISETVAWSAKHRNVDAMYIMGLFFLGYYKCIPDHRKAFYWLKKAAMKQHVDAMYQLGYCYEFGIGIKSDDSEAFHWYLEAGKNNYYLAEKKLAFCYSTGKLGCCPNTYDARKWHACCMRNPRRSFFENKERWNIPPELLRAGYTSKSKVFKGERYLVNAVKYAAKCNTIKGKYCLALLYTSGFGGNDVLEKDNDKAMKIFEELINEYEHPESMYCLARLYEERQSDGSQPKFYLALKLYKEAAKRGEESAKQVLHDLRSMPMEEESRTIKNEVKRYQQMEYLKLQQVSKKSHKRSSFLRVRTMFALTKRF